MVKKKKKGKKVTYWLVSCAFRGELPDGGWGFLHSIAAGCVFNVLKIYLFWYFPSQDHKGHGGYCLICLLKICVRGNRDRFLVV